jgi:hypothetical protein
LLDHEMRFLFPARPNDDQDGQPLLTRQRSLHALDQSHNPPWRDAETSSTRAHGSANTPENARRIWVTINELKAEDWGIGGHTDWLRDYTSALEAVGEYTAPA